MENMKDLIKSQKELITQLEPLVQESLEGIKRQRAKLEQDRKILLKTLDDIQNTMKTSHPPHSKFAHIVLLCRHAKDKVLKNE